MQLKRFLFFFFVGVISFATIFAQAELPKEINIGFIPSGDKETLKKGSLVLAKQLQDELSIPVNVYVSKDYTSMIEAMKSGKVDFAFLSAASYVAAEDKLKVQVLLKKVWFEPFYYSALIVRKESIYKKITDLKGKRIAFVDPKSTSGFLYPKLMMKKAGVDEKIFSEVIFSGSHAESVHLLEQKKVEAIAVFSDDKLAQKSAWTKFSKNDPKGKMIRLLWLSEPIPNDPFCVRSEFYDKNPKLTHDLMFALIDAYEKIKNQKIVTDIIGAQGFLPATSRQYDPVRELVKELGQQ